MPDTEGTNAPAQRHFWRRREFWIGIVAAPAPLWTKYLLWVVERGGDVDFLISLWQRVQPFAIAHWDKVLMFIGFGLVFHSIWLARRQSKLDAVAAPAATGGLGASVTEHSIQQPVIPATEPMAPIESVQYLRVLYKEHWERALSLAFELFWAELYPNLRDFVGYILKEYVLPRLTDNKSALDQKLKGRGGFTNSEFTDSVLFLFRKTLLDYVSLVAIIKGAGTDAFGDKFYQLSWYGQLYSRHMEAVQKLREAQYHPDVGSATELLFPMLDNLLPKPEEDRQAP